MQSGMNKLCGGIVLLLLVYIAVAIVVLAVSFDLFCNAQGHLKLCLLIVSIIGF